MSEALGLFYETEEDENVVESDDEEEDDDILENEESMADGGLRSADSIPDDACAQCGKHRREFTKKEANHTVSSVVRVKGDEDYARVWFCSPSCVDEYNFS